MNEINHTPAAKPGKPKFDGGNTEFINIQDFQESDPGDQEPERSPRRYRKDPSIVSFSGRQKQLSKRRQTQKSKSRNKARSKTPQTTSPLRRGKRQRPNLTGHMTRVQRAMAVLRAEERIVKWEYVHSGDIEWRNTNKLLFRSSEYVGVKTGHTRNARYCLASRRVWPEGDIICSNIALGF